MIGKSYSPFKLFQISQTIGGIRENLPHIKHCDVSNKCIPLYGLGSPLNLGGELPKSPNVFGMGAKARIFERDFPNPSSTTFNSGEWHRPSAYFFGKTRFPPRNKHFFEKKKSGVFAGRILTEIRRDHFPPVFGNIFQTGLKKKMFQKGSLVDIKPEKGLIFPERGPSRHETCRNVLYFSIIFGIF